MRSRVSALLVALLMAGPPAARAHHSFGAIWDDQKVFQVTGVLTKVDWINPHAYFYVDVTARDGTLEHYAFEGFPPPMLRRLGMTRDLLTSEIGQTVTIEAYPAKDGTRTIGFGRTLHLHDGRVIDMVPKGASESTLGAPP